MDQNNDNDKAPNAIPFVPKTGQPTSAPPAAQANPSARKSTTSRADQEFLPAALEILETPPSPVMTSLIWLLTAFVVTALVWAWFGRIDIIAMAQGKIQPPGRVKIVQPVEAGKVSEIKVTNGDHVAKGDVLITFEPDEAKADVDNLESATLGFEAEILRRGAAVETAGDINGQHQLVAIDWPEHIPSAMRQREEGVLTADLSQLSAQVSAIDAQADVKRSEQQRLTSTIEAQTSLVATLQKRVDMRAGLVPSGAGSKASVFDSQEVLQRETAILVGEKGQLGEAENSIKSFAAERQKQVQSFLAENVQKRSEASKQHDDYGERLVKVRNRLKHMTLYSPADGTVQASNVFTIGQVVTAGQEIMRIVPSDAKLEVEAYLPNKDIGFVELGQEVTVKVESFPFTRYGMLTGHVSHLAHDAIPLPEASQIEGNPAQSNSTATFAGAERTQNLVFPMTISLDNPVLVVDGKPVAMSPGMTVSAEIKTGSRRILEYVFSPLAETTSESMKER
jgi:hemolysin D